MKMDILESLQRLFANVCYRSEVDKYEIGGMVLLDATEASAVGTGARTLEQVVIERSTPAHLRHLRFAAPQPVGRRDLVKHALQESWRVA